MRGKAHHHIIEKVCNGSPVHIKQVFFMLISRRKVNHDRYSCLKTFTPSGKEVRVDKISMDSGVQMMQEHESCGTG